MNFPSILTVVAKDKRSGLGVPNLAIILVLFARRKNDYIVGPLITDASGKVRFIREDCEAAIDRAQRAFIMDYEGDLESCRPVIEVRLHIPDHIKTMLHNHSAFPDFWGQGRSPEFFSELATVNNNDYEAATATATEEQLAINPRLELSLSKKVA